MGEVYQVPAGTYEALEASARAIASPVHFAIERLTGGAYAELAAIADIPPHYPVPKLFAERHYPNGTPPTSF